MKPTDSIFTALILFLREWIVLKRHIGDILRNFTQKKNRSKNHKNGENLWRRRLRTAGPGIFRFRAPRWARPRPRPRRSRPARSTSSGRWAPPTGRCPQTWQLRFGFVFVGKSRKVGPMSKYLVQTKERHFQFQGFFNLDRYPRNSYFNGTS